MLFFQGQRETKFPNNLALNELILIFYYLKWEFKVIIQCNTCFLQGYRKAIDSIHFQSVNIWYIF